jgi:hypothetical protein
LAAGLASAAGLAAAPGAREAAFGEAPACTRTGAALSLAVAAGVIGSLAWGADAGAGVPGPGLAGLGLSVTGSLVGGI